MSSTTSWRICAGRSLAPHFETRFRLWRVVASLMHVYTQARPGRAQGLDEIDSLNNENGEPDTAPWAGYDPTPWTVRHAVRRVVRWEQAPGESLTSS